MFSVSTEILDCFFNHDEIINIRNYGGGHINGTFLVNTKQGDFVLQKINKSVFNTEHLIHNYNELNKADKILNVSLKLYPDFIVSRNNNIHHIDKTGSAWRLIEYVDNCATYSISPNTIVSELAGTTMGRFQAFLNKLDPENFKDTIPDFHNPARRLSDFYTSVNNAEGKVVSSAINEIQFAKRNKQISEDMAKYLSQDILPTRITHNDTKIDNILFLKDKKRAYVIDLDTVMKGAIAFDFGDMVRSITSGAREDEPDLSKVAFNLDHFRSLAKGYLTTISDNISENEKDSLLPGILSVIYTQGIRFLTDHLSGNKYYKIQYPEHNLVRCRTQFKLLQDIMEKRNEVSDVIYKFVIK